MSETVAGTPSLDARLDARLDVAPRTELVRTARLVAGAAARRAGVHEDVIDEVRLAVGEAATRAVLRHRAAGTDTPVVLRWGAPGGRFVVEVVDVAPGAPDPGGDAGLALALIEALVPGAGVTEGPGGGSVLRLAWPIDVVVGEPSR